MTVHTFPRAAVELVTGAGPHWAVRESTLLALLEAEGFTPPAEAAVSRTAGLGASAIAGPVAVLGVYGILTARPTVLGSWLGWTSMGEFRSAVEAAAAEPSVRALLLDTDSPGGQVQGVIEAADALFRARQRKPVIAAINAQAASASYWLASQADEIFVTESGEVGSIGVLSVRVDTSEAEAKAGVRFNVIRSSRYKGEGLPFTPASDAELVHLQTRALEYHARFVADVARGRKVSAETVASTFGEGRMVGARQAVALGMADRIASFPDLFRELLRRYAPLTPEDRARRVRLLEATAHHPDVTASKAAARQRHLDLLSLELDHLRRH